MSQRRTQKIRHQVDRLLVQCEMQNDFWPNARYFFDVGETGLAFEGLYLYLLARDDLWKEHHSQIRRIRNECANFIDFDALESDDSVKLSF